MGTDAGWGRAGNDRDGTEARQGAKQLAASEEQPVSPRQPSPRRPQAAHVRLDRFGGETGRLEPKKELARKIGAIVELFPVYPNRQTFNRKGPNRKRLTGLTKLMKFSDCADDTACEAKHERPHPARSG